ncbi:MAG: D-sedoheptulose 7-phosphate isomerase [Acidaminococcus sp.]|jgi:D-sedoheptulose 7-phosphate isomerase|nr:D-sedoheptulose 7-phosphate isomerase [Acidaminococcus sp.]MCI2100392.1 D-sedoheptulose 7-phosphate isomerase [Acidaminococcus sp.]MCI2114713.1 D-sedoheptulose 7-phosphate isomerase [Acidaminococcus sp.]MCI2116712.1 D-sedoheptulose 7-phosphate isomerase [Acidaminococcus sp.]
MTSSVGNVQEVINARFLEHEKLIHRVMGSKRLMKNLEDAAGLMKMTLASGRKIMFCGNGGSAADAQHWAAEIVGRFKKEREGMAGLALTTDTSILTAVGNDYGFDRIFARQVEGLGQEGDLLLAISTSGNSANVIQAIEAARKKGIRVIGFTARTGGKMAEMCDILLNIPEDNTARVQEIHELMGHILCELVEA